MPKTHTATQYTLRQIIKNAKPGDFIKLKQIGTNDEITYTLYETPTHEKRFKIWIDRKNDTDVETDVETDGETNVENYGINDLASSPRNNSRKRNVYRPKPRRGRSRSPNRTIGGRRRSTRKMKRRH